MKLLFGDQVTRIGLEILPLDNHVTFSESVK